MLYIPFREGTPDKALVRMQLGDEAAAIPLIQENARGFFEQVPPDSIGTLAVRAGEVFFTLPAAVAQHGARFSERRTASHVRLNDLGYRAFLQEATRRNPDDAATLHRLADLLSTAPEEFRDPTRALELAEKAFGLDPDNGMTWQSLGWARYRVGDWKGCIESLEKQKSYPGAGDFVAAMAYWRLGEETKAREVFDRADRWLPGYEQRCAQRSEEGTVTHPPPVMLRRLRVEAAAMLGVETPRAEAKSNSSPKPPGPPG